MRLYMKKFYIAVLGLLLACCLVQAVSAAYTVKTYDVSPKGELTSGDHVSVNVDMSFPGSGDLTFSDSDTLKFFTDLDQATWKMTIVIEGKENPIPTTGGKLTTLSGFLLSYPEDIVILLNVHLEGVVPNVSSNPTITLIKIQEVDKNLAIISGGEYAKTITVFNPAAVATSIQLKETDLAALRVKLDEKIRMGVDTSGAEAKYQDARTAINSAKTAPATQAQTYLNNAQTYMTEASTLLDRAWAQSEITKAETIIKDTDDLITYFTVNRSLGSDSRVSVIVTKRDIAGQSLSQAKTFFNQANYAQSRITANESQIKAYEAYNQSVILKNSLGGEGGFGIDLGAVILFVEIFVALAIIGVAGYFVYNKFFKWDELG
jgi:ribosomal protein L7/L12